MQTPFWPENSGTWKDEVETGVNLSTNLRRMPELFDNLFWKLEISFHKGWPEGWTMLILSLPSTIKAPPKLNIVRSLQLINKYSFIIQVTTTATLNLCKAGVSEAPTCEVNVLPWIHSIQVPKFLLLHKWNIVGKHAMHWKMLKVGSLPCINTAHSAPLQPWAPSSPFLLEEKWWPR